MEKINPSPSQDGNHFLITTLILSGAFIYYLSYLRYGLVQGDEGLLLDCVRRTMQGEQWWVDFFPPYGAVRYWLIAKVFSITGISFMAYRLYYVGIRLLGLGFMMAVGRRLMPAKWAALALVPAIVAPSHLFKSEQLLWPMMTLWLVFRCWESAKTYFPAILGAAAGFSFWFRPEIVVPFAVISVFGVEVGHYFSGVPAKDRWMRRAALALGIVVGLVLPAALFPGFWLAFLIYSRWVVSGMSLGLGSPWPRPQHLWVNRDQAATFLVLTGTILLYIGIALDILRELPHAWTAARWRYRLMILATGCATIYGAIYQSNLGHMLQVLAPAYTLIVEGGYRVISSRRSTNFKAAFGTIMFAPLLVFVFYALFLSRTVEVGSISMRRIMKTPIYSALGTVYYISPISEQIQAVVDYVKANSGPDDFVAAIPDILTISVMAQRKNPCMLVPIVPIYLDYLKPQGVKKFYSDFSRANLIVYFERPTRLEKPRPQTQRLRYYLPALYDMILKDYTFVKRFGDYIILRKGPDSAGATRAFMEGWDAYQYKNYEAAQLLFEDAVRLGGPAPEINPLIEKIKERQKKP